MRKRQDSDAGLLLYNSGNSKYSLKETSIGNGGDIIGVIKNTADYTIRIKK